MCMYLMTVKRNSNLKQILAMQKCFELNIIMKGIKKTFNDLYFNIICAYK